MLTTYIPGATSYTRASGTSLAAPQVSGAVALCFAAVPEANHTQVRNALLSSVDAIPALATKVSSGGRLNVAKALATLLGKPYPYVPTATWTVVQEADTAVDWNGYWTGGQAVWGYGNYSLQGCIER